MAIAIKSVPVLKGNASVGFAAKASIAMSKKKTVNFSKEVKVSTQILAKAKI